MIRHLRTSGKTPLDLTIRCVIIDPKEEGKKETTPSCDTCFFEINAYCRSTFTSPWTTFGRWFRPIVLVFGCMQILLVALPLKVGIGQPG